MSSQLNTFPPRLQALLLALLSLIIIVAGLPAGGQALAHPAGLPTPEDVAAFTPPPRRSPQVDAASWREGPTLIVTNTNMEMNGDHWLPEWLIANPGPDGISLREAIEAVKSSDPSGNQHETITFDPSLKGAVITTTVQLTVIADGLTIDGDLDDDGIPDITLDGQGGLLGGLWISGASHVTVEGIRFRNFGNPATGGTGISVGFNLEEEGTEVENIILRNNWIGDVPEACIDVSVQGRSHVQIHNLEIVGNRLEGCSAGVALWGAQAAGTSDNEIAHVKILDNTFIGGGANMGVIVRGAGMTGGQNSHRNLVDDVEIRGNTMTGFAGTGTNKVTILVDAANQPDCDDNTISNLTIAENVIDGFPMAVELVATGESGTGVSGNTIAGVRIEDNVLTGGGIQLVGAQAGLASGNTVRDVLIDRNLITGCSNAGVIAYPGASSSMSNNTVEDVIIRNNAIAACTGAGILLDCPNGTCSQGNAIDNVAVLNNTLVGNGFENGTPSTWASGLRIDDDYAPGAISSVVISNTILWGNNFDDALAGPFDTAEVTVAHSVISDTRYTGHNGNFYADPQFANPGAGDFRLQSGSPCVDAGDPGAALVGPLDLDRTARLWDGGSGSAIVDCGAFETGAPGIAEIAVTGADLPIHNLDMIPAPWDGTAFPSLRVAGETVTHTFTIANSGEAPLALTGLPRVAISGANASDFTVTAQPGTTPLVAGASTTFTVTFDPSAPGLRTATLTIPNDDLDEDPYSFALEGVGSTPEIRVEGNDLEIPDGDTTPREADGTDFGTVTTGGAFSGRMYVLINTGSAPLTLDGNPPVIITGTHAADFWVESPPPTTVGVDSWPYPVEPWPAFSIMFMPQGAGLRTAVVSIPNDDLDEDPYTFAIQGTGVDLPALAFSSYHYDVAEGVGTATITATLSLTASEPVVIEYETSELGSATPCTGSGPCDYHPIGFDQLTFAPGETVATLGVEIVDDALFEPEIEEFQIRVGSASNNVTLLQPEAFVRIEDDDSPPLVGFSAPGYQVSEGAGVAPITVTLQGQSAVTATVLLSTGDGSALAGVDYAETSIPLTFSPGTNSRVVLIEIVADQIFEAPETVLLTLSDPQNALLTGDNPVTLTIVDESYRVFMPMAVRG